MTPSNILQAKLKPPIDMEKILARSDQAVVFDLETTGFSPSAAYSDIIEIGAVKVDLNAGKIIDKFNTFVKPVGHGGKIPNRISELTSITTDMVKDAPYIEQILPDFYDFIGDLPVIAHNAEFDWFRFMQFFMQKIGRIVTNEVICTLKLSQDLHPFLTKHGLEALTEYYGNPIEGHHRAIVDARYTASIAVKMRQEILDGKVGTKNLFHTASKPNILPSKIGFASVQDMKIKNVKEYEYKDKKMGKAYFLTTSLGRIYYHIKRDCFGFQQLFVAKNVDMEALRDRLMPMIA